MTSAAERCLSDDDIATIIEGRGSPAGLDAHLDSCESCFLLLAASASGRLKRDSSGTQVPLANRYEFRGVLGEGGMGRVLLGHDTFLDRPVALKVIRSEAFERRHLERARTRMREEAKLMARVSHPNVVHVYDVGEASEGLFIAMEYVPGTSIDTWILERAPGPTAITRAVLGAAEGLAAAHARGVVHRDVKPSNLLIDDKEHVRVTDFGLARAAVSAAIRQVGSYSRSGTPGYMAPEQARGDIVTPAVDQYALAIAALDSFTAGSTVCVESVRAAVREPCLPWPEPRFHGAPLPVVPVLRRATAVDPSRRFPTMKAFAQALGASLPAMRRDLPAERPERTSPAATESRRPGMWTVAEHSGTAHDFDPTQQPCRCEQVCEGR